MKIRKARLEDASGIAKVKIDTWQTTYRGLIPDTYLDNLSFKENERSYIGRLNNPDQDSFINVAENETGQIIGFVYGGAERTGQTTYSGEIYAIYVLTDFQRKGVGKLLLRSAIQTLKQLNLSSMLIWALAGNKFAKFYKDLGGQQVFRKTHDFGEFATDNEAYAWKDIDKICFGEGGTSHNTVLGTLPLA